MAGNLRLTCRSLPRPTRSTAVFVRPGFEPMAAKPDCRRYRVQGCHPAVGIHASGRQTASHGSETGRPGPERPGCVTARHGKVLTPFELERLPWVKGQSHESPASCGLALHLPIRPPVPGKRCNMAIRGSESQRYQISMQLLHRPPLLARLARLRLHPAGKLLGKRIKFAHAVRRRECWLHYARIQILRDGIAR